MISHSVLQGCGSLVSAEAYIRQEPLPLMIFPLRSVLNIGFHYLVSLPLTLAYVWLSKGMHNPVTLLSLIPTLILLFLFGWSLATLAGICHVYFPDTQHLLEIALQAMFFLTPIAYPAKVLEGGRLGVLLQYNPLAVLIGLVREPLVFGHWPSLSVYGVAVLLVLVPMCCAALLVSRVEPADLCSVTGQ